MSINDIDRSTRLRIWQQNVGKSWPATLHLINAGLHDDYDVIALQEPYLDSLGNTRASHKWRVIYPTKSAGGRHPYRTVLLINNSISTSICQPMPFPSHDVIAVHFAFPNNPFTLFSIYNDGEHDITVDTLSKFHEEHKAAIYPSPNAHVVWVGDFNRHHLYWDREEDHHLFTPNALQASEHLLEVVTDWSMHMALPPRIPTHEHYVSKRRSRLDNVFCTEHTAGLLQ